MKILNINKYFYIKGGSETYSFGLKRMLEEHGHDVIDFSMKSEKNYSSPYEDYFVKNVNYNHQNMLNRLKNALKLIYSNEAYDNLKRLIKATKPDIAHVNLVYHQLSPSVFHALKDCGVRVVYTSHDYKIICPNYKLFNSKGVCTRCLDGNFLHCSFQKCHKDSYLYSVLLTGEAYLHKFLKSYEIPEVIICPSLFVKEILKKSGIEGKKLVHLPNFISGDIVAGSRKMMALNSSSKGNYIVYFGRLSAEKGLDTLLDAWKMIDFDSKLLIIGTGPEETRLRGRINHEKIRNVEMVGYLSGEDLYLRVLKAKAAIIPSIWSEVFGLTVIEAYSFGTPSIGSKIGGITETIHDSVTGYHFDSGQPKSLAEKINKLLSLSLAEYNDMRQACLLEAENYRPDRYYQKIMEIYQQVLSNKICWHS